MENTELRRKFDQKTIPQDLPDLVTNKDTHIREDFTKRETAVFAAEWLLERGYILAEGEHDLHEVLINKFYEANYGDENNRLLRDNG
jgi:hypothetical protein